MYRITIGIDAEPPSRTAVDWVLAWHGAREAHITLVTAYDLLLQDPDADLAVLEDHAARLREALPGATVEVLLAEGSIPRVLEGLSGETDLLVVGAHRTRPLRSALTGRLPLRVAERASSPVVVVPDDWRPGSGPVVAGVADDESADAALQLAVDEAVALGVELRLVHAWQVPVLGSELDALIVDAEALESEHAALLSRVADGLRRDGVQVRESLRQGPSATAIADEAEDATLVVVGSHRRHPVAAAVLGSTVGALLGASRAPVCVVPPR